MNTSTRSSDVSAASRSAVPLAWGAGFLLAVVGLLIATLNFILTLAKPDFFAAFLAVVAVILAAIWWTRIVTPLPNAPLIRPPAALPQTAGNTDPRAYRRPPPPTPMYAQAPATVEPPPDPQWLAKDEFFSGLDASDGSVAAFILPKRDTDGLLECEDSYALNLAERRYAVTDGVGGSELPRPWARLIAQTFVAHPDYFTDPEQFQAQIPALGERWRAWVKDTWFPKIFHRPPTEADTDFQRRLVTGAQTTLIGCALVRNPDNRQQIGARVVAVGDANFLHLRKGPLGRWQRLAAFPLDDPTLFGRHPNTLLTNPQYTARSMEWVKQGLYPVQPGDLLVLGSDSIAKWLLDQMNEDGDQWEDLLACRDPQDFAARIEVARTGKPNQTALEDDDVTLVIVPVPAGGGK